MEELIGKKIESYTFLSILGKGGMGTVYKAYDEKLDRHVAIKILDVKVIDKTKFIERFKREARHQAQLSHPNIVTVYGFIDSEGTLGIVMEYVEGESLEKVIFRQRRLHIFDVVYIMRQALLAIGYAHKKGFVHRDIKPSNIILNTEGTVKIMDFGISKSLEDRSMTKTGAQLGTVFYMSPEQIKGNDVTHLTDIYSIGCTLYEMIAGQPPFNYESEYDVMDAHLKKEPPKMSQIIPGTPSVLDRIISTCLMKNTAGRYQNCAEIIEELHGLDEYLTQVEAKYFIRTKKDPSKTKYYSMLAFSTFIMVMAALTYFVYVQVGELLRSGEIDRYKLYKIQDLFGSGRDSLNVTDVTVLRTGNGVSLNAIQFISESFGIAVGDSATLLMTNDAGNSWSDQRIPISTNFLDTYFFGDGTSFIVGDNSTLLRSDNFFKNYSEVNVPPGYSLFKIKFINRLVGFILGSSGLILKTNDGGKTWKKVVINTQYTLYDIHFIDDKTGMIVGWNGAYFKTEDGGITWYVQKSFTDKYLKSINFIDNRLGLAVGGGNTIFRTVDGGRNWEKTFSNTLSNYQSVTFIDENVAVLIGHKGIILYSEDKGISWQRMDSYSYANLNSMTLSPDNKIFVVSVNGEILRIF